MFAALVACVDLEGFGAVSGAWVVPVESDQGKGGVAVVEAAEAHCSTGHASVGGEDDADFCAFLVEYIEESAAIEEVVIEGAERDVLVARWEVNVLDLDGRSTDDVWLSPCYGEKGPDAEMEAMDAEADLEAADESITLTFDGDVEGEVEAYACDSAQM